MPKIKGAGTIKVGGSTTPPAPTIYSNDMDNTISAEHYLGTSQILVSENNSAYIQYTGVINVGNVPRPVGYWKFKTKAATGRNESPVAQSAPFTQLTYTLAAPENLAASNVTSTSLKLSWSASQFATTYALYGSINGVDFGEIYRGSNLFFDDDAQPNDTYHYKVKALAPNTSYIDSPISNTITVNIPPAFSTPIPPNIIADDINNTLSATHSLGTSEILISENNGPFIQYNGGVINVGNVERQFGYWRFKIKSGTNRNESEIANSPNFTIAGAAPSGYTIAQTSKVSTGVFKTDGTLVRTLEKGVTKQPGTYNPSWDGKDDKGVAVPSGSYQIRPISNNLIFTPKGIVGNTSTNKTGSAKYRSYDSCISLCIAGGKMFQAMGYLEETSNSACNLTTPQIRFDPNHQYNSGGSNQNSNFVVTDGTNVFWVGYDAWATNDNVSFVCATRVSDSVMVTFPNGTNFKTSHGNTWVSALNIVVQDNSQPTGAAVSTNFIWVARKGLNTLTSINRTSGAVVQVNTLSAPTAIASDGNFLWVTTDGNNVQKYPINSNGTLGSPILSLSGLSKPVGMKVNGSILAIIDSGTSQQVKAYNTSNASLLWTLGQAGGFMTSPVVTNDRFAFWKKVDGVIYEMGGIDFAPDGSFWLTCVRTGRRLHYSADRVYIEQIQHMSRNYTLSVNPNDTKRVICNNLEYEIDYTKDVIAGNGSWTLKYCWDKKDNAHEDYQNLVTFPNGKTYGFFRKGTVREVIEYNTTTGVIYTGQTIPTDVPRMEMQSDGSLKGFRNNGNGQTLQFVQRLLTGYTNNAPTWGSETILVSTSDTSSQNPTHISYVEKPYSKTTGNIVPVFRGLRVKLETGVYHLGGLKAGSNQYLFKTMITDPRGDGDTFPFPTNGDYNVGGFKENQGNQGNLVHAVEECIVAGYHGEFYKGGQTNYYYWYHESGLFLGLMGTEGNSSQRVAPLAGMAGNGFANSVFKVGSNYYLLHNDESWHSGIGFWEITGVNSIVKHSPIAVTI